MITKERENCYFLCGKKAVTTTRAMFLDASGNSFEEDVPYCGRCVEE
jgi:hypothetical protein